MAQDRAPRPDAVHQAEAHEKARDLAGRALDDLAHGRERAADRHVAQAKALDEGALREVAQDLEEDAGSNPDAVKDRRD